ncbi:MAG: hypothetical protein WCA83_05050 [Azonexus sp.]
MKILLSTFAAALLSVTVLPALAADAVTPDAGSAAIEAMGKVNGMALACKQPVIVTRARNAVIDIASKTRTNGEIFENATNAAFLEQGKGAACPDTASFVAALDEAEKKLQAAFPAAK